MPLSDTINSQIRLLLEDPDFAAGVLRQLAGFFRDLDRGAIGGRPRIGELLTIRGVPVWDLLRHELLQILEPELYRVFLARSAIERLGSKEILLLDEQPTWSRAIRCCAAADGRRLRTLPWSGGRLRDEPVRPPSAIHPRATSAHIRKVAGAIRCARAASGPARILISPEWISNTQILRPLSESLSADPDLSVHFLRRSVRHDISGIPFDRIWELNDVLALGSPANLQSLRRDVGESLDLVARSEAWRHLFRDGNCDFEPLVRRKLRAVFSPARVGAVVCRATGLLQFLDRLRPDLIIDSDGIMLTSVATDWAASSLDIPRLKILHYDEQLFRMWTLLSAKDWDRVAVMGPAPKAALRELGMPDERIFVTGYPFFDERLRAMRNTPARRANPKRVLFVAQGLPEEAEVFRRILDAFEQLPAYQLVARTHPLRPESLDWVWSGQPSAIDVVRAPQEPLYDSIAASALVMTISSIAALEAVLMGKPVLLVEPRPGHPHNPSLFYSRHEVGRQLFDLDRIATAIRELCEDATRANRVGEGRRRIMEEYFGSPSPAEGCTATQQLARLVHELALSQREEAALSP